MAALPFLLSDENMKEDIEEIDEPKPFTKRLKQLPIKRWRYKGDPVKHIGPMAQDVERIDPKAVKTVKGIKHIDPRRVMGGILRAA